MNYRLICALTIAIVATASQALAANPADGPATSTTEQTAKEKVVTLAGGCFWCTEAVLEKLEGVNDVVSGYIGGRNANPTYKQVCTGLTNHAEAVEVYYDPDKICLEELLSMFFKTHDPTTLNKQGADEGTQYRSSVFYRDEEQKTKTLAYIKKIATDYRTPIVTQLEKATTFYPAEEYHQDFFRKNPTHGYCRAVVAKKVRKAKNVLNAKKKEVKDPC